MRTNESGSVIKGFSCDSYIEDLIEKYSKFYGISKSSFMRLGVKLAANKLANKQFDKVKKIVGVTA
jgi:hypothetical protein